MNKIASTVYKSLSARQRVIACVAAQARDDEDEYIRLIKTCPKLTYLQNDVNFSETIKKLMGLAMAVEADLRGSALGYFAALRIEPKIAPKFLQEISDVRAAWKITVSEMGIDPDSMQKASPPPSPILELIHDLIPIPDQENAKKVSGEMCKLIKVH